MNPMDHPSPHYAFAHLAMLKYAKRFSTGIFSQFDPTALAIFGNPLRVPVDTANELASGVPRLELADSDIQVTHHRVGDKPCLILQMPPTTIPTEVFFIAIVSAVPEAEMRAIQKELVSLPIDPFHQPQWLLNYFTLEVPYGHVTTQKSVFCEWENDSRHVNLGAGPDPTFSEFLRFLEAFLTRANRPSPERIERKLSGRAAANARRLKELGLVNEGPF